MTLLDYRRLIDEIAAAHATLDRNDGIPDSGQDREFTAATIEDISAAEARLSCTFPPSYRAFLLAVNGCSKLGMAHGGLLPVTDVTWFRDSNPDWIDAYIEAATDDITEEEHLECPHDSARFRLAYLPELLQIGDEYDSSVYLLNPLVTNPDGEWEAWTFANWYPGGIRKPSFADLVTSAHSEVLHELHLQDVQVDENAVFAKALPIIRERIANGETPSTAIATYLTSAGPFDEMLAAWMRTKQPYYALLEALGYPRQ